MEGVVELVFPIQQGGEGDAYVGVREVCVQKNEWALFVCDV